MSIIQFATRLIWMVDTNQNMLFVNVNERTESQKKKTRAFNNLKDNQI